ncbi:MAG: M15 family metallopeptidase [Actinomycetota bacterium]
MKSVRVLLASGFNPHYSLGRGSHRRFIVSGLALSLAGALMMLALVALRSHGVQAEARDVPLAPAVPGRPNPGAFPVLTVFTDREALPALASAARQVPEVTAVAEFSSATRWLTMWNNEGDAPVFAPPGQQIPVDIGSVDPAEYQQMVPEMQRRQLLDLPEGGALISRSAAKLRGIENTGTLRFGTTWINVVGVVDDELTRGHEVLVTHRTGAALAVTHNRYLEIALTSLNEAAAVMSELRKHVPAGVPAKIRGPLGSDIGDGGGLLPLADIKTIFGEFPARLGTGMDIRIPQEWIDANTAVESVPLVGEFRCHKAMFPQIRGAVAAVEQAGLGPLIDGSDFGGCFSPRFIRAGREGGLSRHSWGAAIDFNVSGNLMGNAPTIDRRIVEIMEQWGFSWGGDWTEPDGMHFEFVFSRTQ